MPEYAKTTTVSADKTLTEIRAVILKYKASAFAFAEQHGKVGVTFEMENRRVRFVVPLPNPTAREFTHVKANQYGGMRRRSAKEHDSAYEQAVRQRWRALLLTIKAKLESVESGIETFEEAFASQLVLANGQTVGEYVLPLVINAYEHGEMPAFPLLGSGGR